MTAPNLEFRDNGDALIATATSEPGAVGGTPTTAVVYHIWNDFGGSAGSDDAEGYRIHALSKDSGDSDNRVESGHEYVDRRYFEARITGGLGGLVVGASSWQKLGNGLSFPLPVIGSNEGVVLEVRVDSPGDAPTGHYLPLLQIRGAEAVAGAGEWPNGILLGPGGIPVILKTGNVVENPAAVDDQVQAQSTIWQAPEPTYVVTQALVQLNANDGNSVALASGEAYYGRVVAAADGTITVRKGAKATTPLSPSDEPALSVGDIEIALVLREFDGLINDADITNRWVLGAYGWKSASALTVTLGAGSAHVAQALVQHDTESPVTVADDDDNWIWIQPDGTFAVTQNATPPTPGSMLIWTATAAAGSITSFADQRVFKGVAEVRIVFHFSGALSGQNQYAHWPFPAPGRLRGIEPVTVSLSADWAGTGSVIFQLDDSLDGATWDPFFNAAAPDERPSIPNGSVFDSSGVPKKLTVRANAVLRASIPTVPTGGTDPQIATLVAIVDL